MLSHPNVDQNTSTTQLLMNKLLLQNLLMASQFQHQQLLFQPNLIDSQIQQQKHQQIMNSSIQKVDQSPQQNAPPNQNSSLDSTMFQHQLTPLIQTPSSIPSLPSPFYPLNIINNHPVSLVETEKKFCPESFFATTPQLDQIQKATKTSLFELFPQKAQPVIQFNHDLSNKFNNNQYSVNQPQQIDPFLAMPSSFIPFHGLLQNPQNLLAAAAAAASNMQPGFSILNRNQDPSQFDNFKLNSALSLNASAGSQFPFQNHHSLALKQQVPVLPNGLQPSKCLQEDDSELEPDEDSVIIKDEHISNNDNQSSSDSSSFGSEEERGPYKKRKTQVMGKISSTLLNRRLNGLKGLQQKKGEQLNDLTKVQPLTIKANGKPKQSASNLSPQSRPRAKNLSVSTAIEFGETKHHNEYIQSLRNQFLEVNSNLIPNIVAPSKKIFLSVQEGYAKIRQSNSLDFKGQKLLLPDKFTQGFTDNLLSLTDSIQENSLIKQNPHLIYGHLLKPLAELPLDVTSKEQMNVFRKPSSDDQLFGFQMPLPSLNLASFMSIPQIPSIAEGLSLNNDGGCTPFSLKNSLRKVQSDAEPIIQSNVLIGKQPHQQILDIFSNNRVKLNENRPRGVSFQSLPSTNNGFSPTRHPSSRLSFLSTQTPVLNPVLEERILLNLYSQFNKKDVERSRQFGTAKNTSSNRQRQRAESLPVDIENTPVQEIIGSPVSKRSKYHNLTKLFMYFLLSLFSNENMEKLNIPKFIQDELVKCVQNVKKTAKKKIKNHNLQKTDFFNHTHYNVLFLHLNKKSLKELQKKDKDIEVHKQCYNIDLREINDQRLEYVNILKKFAYEIVANTLESPSESDCLNNPRNEYMLKALSGIRQLAQGNAIFRFQQVYTGQSGSSITNIEK